MGLDQYLEIRKYVSRWNYSDGFDSRTENPEFTAVAGMFAPEMVEENGHAGITVSLPAGYWRKANQVHNWFVDNVQNGEDDCGNYWVHQDQLQELLDLCNKVLADHSLADELLPSASGFFFGSTEYDEWYFEQLKNTVEILTRVLGVKDAEIYYTSSW